MYCQVTIMPLGTTVPMERGITLLEGLRRWGQILDAPCGGNGTCGKCTVLVDGAWVKACGYRIEKDISVFLPGGEESWPVEVADTEKTDEICAAFDIGTTTVVAALMVCGKTFTAAERNPQVAFGADVISRIQYAGKQGAEPLQTAIVGCARKLLERLCQEAQIAPEKIKTISVVGNSCMQQLFLGMDVKNLSTPPFDAKIQKTEIFEGKKYFPDCKNAELITMPDVAGFVGGDTVACILTSGLLRQKETVLLVDIGTNGEMALYHKGRLVTCATAAGPALEGANISCGMRAEPGAIDHVTATGLSVIGNVPARGICGSGLVDAVAVLLEKGLLNARGKLLTEEGYRLCDGVCLSQEDIRQVQSAKGAIAAGVELMCDHMGITVEDIDRCLLAGAFGSYLNADNACRMGLLPEKLRGKVVVAGNLALEGAKQLARHPGNGAGDSIVAQAEYLDLSTLRAFPKTFAKNMRFREEPMLVAARECGFSEAAYVDVSGLSVNEMVRSACAADKCHAYGKNWTCPPYIGTLDQCLERIHSYKRGILLQTVGKLEKAIDTKGYVRVEGEHLEAFHKFVEKVRERDPDALCLGSGGCRICKQCACPEPCRFPEKACSSMEGYGLFVTQVCRDNDLKYYYGEKTICYCAMVLFDH